MIAAMLVALTWGPADPIPENLLSSPAGLDSLTSRGIALRGGSQEPILVEISGRETVFWLAQWAGDEPTGAYLVLTPTGVGECTEDGPRAVFKVERLTTARFTGSKLDAAMAHSRGVQLLSEQ